MQLHTPVMAWMCERATTEQETCLRFHSSIVPPPPANCPCLLLWVITSNQVAGMHVEWGRWRMPFNTGSWKQTMLSGLNCHSTYCLTLCPKQITFFINSRKNEEDYCGTLKINIFIVGWARLLPLVQNRIYTSLVVLGLEQWLLYCFDTRFNRSAN